MNDALQSAQMISLSTALTELVVKGTALTVTTRIKEYKEIKEADKLRNAYDSLISELLNNLDEAIRIAQSYKSELERVVISDEDIEHLHNTVSDVLEIVKRSELKKCGQDNELAQQLAKNQFETYEQIKSLISVDTLKTMQLLGFNYKEAIGKPLTDLCSNAILNLGSKNKKTNNKKPY